MSDLKYGYMTKASYIEGLESYTSNIYPTLDMLLHVHPNAKDSGIVKVVIDLCFELNDKELM